MLNLIISVVSINREEVEISKFSVVATQELFSLCLLHKPFGRDFIKNRRLENVCLSACRLTNPYH